MKHHSRFHAFGTAFKGLKDVVLNETHVKIHMLAATTALILCNYLSIFDYRLLFVLAAICFVLMAEIINTAIERLCDVVEPNFDQRIGRIKDISAGAVLIAVIFALAVALLIFVPAVLNKFK